jgi:hypothetical protein
MHILPSFIIKETVILTILLILGDGRRGFRVRISAKETQNIGHR